MVKALFSIITSYQMGGIATLDNGDQVYIPYGQYNQALHLDEVDIAIGDQLTDIDILNFLSEHSYQHEDIKIGKVISIVNNLHETKLISGILNIKSSTIYGVSKNGVRNYLFKPSKTQYPTFVVGSRVNPNDYRKNIYIVVDLIEWAKNDKYPKANCVTIIGEIGHMDNEITNRLYSHNLIRSSMRKNLWISELKERSINYQNIIKSPSEYGYYDLTDKYIFSIDPPNCLDVDDALHFVHNNDHSYELGIHIADVSSWVLENSYLDQYARQRLTTLYLHNQNIPMLPRELSEDQCSLLSGSKKLCLSLILNINKDLMIESFKFIPTVIQNKNQTTYEQIEKLINKGNKLFCELLKITQQLAINHQIDKYHLTEIEQPQAHHIVETCMILTNVYCGSYLQKHGHDCILRVHQKNKLNKIIEPINHHEPELINYIKMTSHNAAEYATISDLKNREMEPKHHGLGLSYYTHFTSPIRRYIDLLNHRHIKMIINESKSSQTDHMTICLKANDINSKAKKLYKDLHYLKLADEIKNNISTKAYVIGFSQDNVSKITLYIPDYKIKKTLTLCHKKVIHLFKITNNLTSLNIENIQTGELFEYHLYDTVEIQITPIFNAENFYEKLKIELLPCFFSQ